MRDSQSCCELHAIGSNDMARQKTAGVLVLASPTRLVDEMDQRARRRVIDLPRPAGMFGR